MKTNDAKNGESDIERVTRALNDHFSARINTKDLYNWMLIAFCATIVFDLVAAHVPLGWNFKILWGVLLLWGLPTLYFVLRFASLGVSWLSFKPFDSKFLSKSIDVDRSLQTVLDRTSFPADKVINSIKTSRKVANLRMFIFAFLTTLLGLFQGFTQPYLNLQGSLLLYHIGKILSGRITGIGYPVAQTPFSEFTILLLVVALFFLLAQSILIDATYAHTQGTLETISKNGRASTSHSRCFRRRMRKT